MSSASGSLAATGSVTLPLDPSDTQAIFEFSGTFGSCTGVFETQLRGGSAWAPVASVRLDTLAVETAPTLTDNTTRRHMVRGEGCSAVRFRATAVGSGSIGVSAVGGTFFTAPAFSIGANVANGYATSSVPTSALAAAAVTLAKTDLRTGLKLLAADGANASGGNQNVTLTGAAVGDRVIAIIGHAKANTGVHTFLIPAVGTAFESTISVVNQIVQLQAGGDLSANTYLFVLAPAAA